MWHVCTPLCVWGRWRKAVIYFLLSKSTSLGAYLVPESLSANISLNLKYSCHPQRLFFNKPDVIGRMFSNTHLFMKHIFLAAEKINAVMKNMFFFDISFKNITGKTFWNCVLVGSWGLSSAVKRPFQKLDEPSREWVSIIL